MGKNITTTPTSDIQKNLGIQADNIYGPQTTAAVKAFQTSSGLTADGIFGPQTLAAYSAKYAAPTSSLVTTSAPARTTYADNSTNLDTALKLFNASNPTASASDPQGDALKKVQSGLEDTINDTTTASASDPYIRELDALAARSNDSTKMLIQNIKTEKMRQQVQTDKQYQSYKEGLQLLGIQTNEASATPDLLASHINQAESEHQDKIRELDAEESKALMDAENARADNDFKTLGAKMDYVKQIKSQREQALKDYYDTLSNSTTSKSYAATQQTAQAAAHDVYDTILSLDDADKESFLVAVSQKFDLPLGTLVTALTDEQNTRTKADTKDDPVLSPTEAATLGVPYGTTESQAQAKGITPARYKPDSGSPTKTAAEELADAKNFLKTGQLPDGATSGDRQYAAQGADGFYDPYAYLAVFNSWKGTPKDFIAKFPLTSINPSSYTLLPQALQNLLPKTKSGRSLTGGL